MNKLLINGLIMFLVLYLIIFNYINVKIDNYEKDVREMKEYVLKVEQSIYKVQNDINEVNSLMNDLSIKLDDINSKMPQ